MDTIKSLLTDLWGRLIDADGDLFSYTGTRVYNTWAPPDSEFPYLVHKIELRSLPGYVFPMRQGSYTIDIWDDSPDVDRLLSIREKIIALLDELIFDTTETIGDVTTTIVSSCRLWLQTDGQIPESEFGIQHYSLLFNIRLYRVSESASIIGR